MAKRQSGKPKKQIAALPIARGPEGALRVLVITSRETRRFIVPKGWPMKGLEDHRAAEIEAREEAGLIGQAHSKPIGSYLSWKRREQSFQLVRAKVFLFDVEGQLETWKEKGQREMRWLSIEDAAAIVDDPGLATVILDLSNRLPKSWRSRPTTVSSLSGMAEGHLIAGPETP